MKTGTFWWPPPGIPEDREKAPEDVGEKRSVRCRRCGRILTDPVSVKLGMGPDCRRAEGAKLV